MSQNFYTPEFRAMEFKARKRAFERDTGTEISAQDFAIVEEVWCFHPAVESDARHTCYDKVVALYGRFGMRIIYDMHAGLKAEKLREAKAKAEKLLREQIAKEEKKLAKYGEELESGVAVRRQRAIVKTADAICVKIADLELQLEALMEGVGV